jgi:dUTP pyrophosphatase
MSWLGGVYLAYPIDQRGDRLTEMFERVDHVKQMLTESGVAAWVFDPGDAFRVSMSADPTDAIASINRHAAFEADVVIAFLPRGVPTIGVPMEIDRAYSQGKLIVLFSDADESWMLQYPNGGGGRIYRRGGWDIDDLMDALDWLNHTQPPPTDKQYDDLKVVLDDAGRMPSRAYQDDAGLDLYVSETTVLPPNMFTDVPCGISVELPYGTWGLVTGRSSALRKKGLLVHSGVIDVGYRGPIFAGAWNQTGKDVEVLRGDRIAQLIILNNKTQYVVPVQAQELSNSARGSQGFGSSGA